MSRYATDPDYRARRRAASKRAYENHKEKTIARVAEYNRQHADERRRWVAAWRRRTGRAVPADLADFRRAVKELEASVERTAHAERVRQPG